MVVEDLPDRAAEVYRDAIVIDMVAPLLDAGSPNTPEYLERFIRGGVTVVGPTVAIDHTLEETIGAIAKWYEWLDQYEDKVCLVTSVEDIYRAKRQGKLGLIFHFQNSVSIGQRLNVLEVYHRLGVRAIQLTYNRRNFVGDGCTEADDAGLSAFGHSVVQEMNRLGIVVDLSHTGYKTTMDAIEVSSDPVMFSHSNAYGIHLSKRNIRDDQIRAVAAKDGVIGLVACPYFVAKTRWPTVERLIDHADYIAALVGTDHISLGLDHFHGMWPFATPADSKKIYDQMIQSGQWDPNTWPPPPWRQAKGIEVPEKTGNLANALLQRGYSEEDVRKILGKNLMRVFSRVWQPPRRLLDRSEG